MSQTKISRRKFLKTAGLAGVGLTAAGLAGCAAPATPTAAPTAAPTSAPGTTKTDKLKLLLVNHFVKGYDDWIKKFATDWGQANGITVTVDFMANLEVAARGASEVAAQKGHDIVQWDQGTGSPFLWKNHTVDLTELVAEVEAKYGEFSIVGKQAGLDAATGAWFSLPVFYTASPALYRKDLWDEIGIKPDTWDEVLEGGRKLKEKGFPLGIGLAHGTDPNVQWQGLSLQLFSNLQTQQENISGRQQRIAQDAANTVSSFIQEKFSVLETTARLANPASSSRPEQELLLQKLLGLQPAFRQLALLDAQYQELAQASRFRQTARHLTDRLEGEVLTGIRRQQRYISPVYVDPVSSEPLVIMSVPVSNVLRDFQGTLAAEVNLRFMWELVDQIEVGQTGYAYVVDDQGNLLAFNDTSRVLLGENVGQISKVNEFVSNPSSTELKGVDSFTGINRTSVVGTYVPLGTPRWAVLTELPWEEAYQEVVWQGMQSVGITLGLAILAGLIGVFLARRLAVPLVDLTAVAGRITSGELELKAKVAGPREIASLAMAFNSMTAQLRQTLEGLELQVADRTRALTLSAEISRRLSSILDQQELVTEVVEQIKAAFDYYQVHIYLYDAKRNYLVLVAGTGEAAQTMLSSRHQLEEGRGLVGRAAGANASVLVPDVSKDPSWLPNPLLPQTQAELAVPIVLGGRVLGVLDVQHDRADSLGQKDVLLIQSIASQVAIALQNTRSYEQAQDRAERETFIVSVGEKIQRAGTLEDVLSIAAQELGRKLNARRATAQVGLNQPATTPKA